MQDGDRTLPELGWLASVREGGGPIYMRIVERLAEARAGGLLQPGDRLPPQRDLADFLGIDLTTVTRALTEARRRNLVDAAPGRGTFVTPGGADEPTLDLSMNIPPAPLGLNLPALIRAGIDGLLKRSSAEALLSYHPGPGSPAERAAGSSWLAGAGDRLPAARVAVGSGAQALLAAVVLSRTAEGETILADALTYPGLMSLAQTARRALALVPRDDDGMLPDALEAEARRHSARMVYLNPTLHNPTALVMPEARRKDIARVARRLGLTIIEDDPYSRLIAAPPASFLMLAPDITFHVATLAKCVSPFLRTAFLAAPDAEAVDGIAEAIRGTTLMAAPLMTGLAAEWVRSGIAAEITGGVRAEAAARQRIAAALLPKDAVMQEGGLHVWLPLRSGMRSDDLVRRAKQRGLAVSPASEFSLLPDATDAVRIALGAAATRERLRDGLESLAAILTDRAAGPAA